MIRAKRVMIRAKALEKAQRKEDQSKEQNQKRQELITKSAAAEAKLALKGSVECITVDEIKAMLNKCASSDIVPFGNWHKPLASRTPPQLTTSLYKQSVPSHSLSRVHPTIKV